MESKRQHDRDIGIRFKAIDEALSRIANAHLAEANLTFSQINVLTAVDEAGGSLSQRDIEQKFGVSHPTVVGLVKRLKAKGYIALGSDPDDARVSVVVLRNEGREALAQGMRYRTQDEEILLRGFSEDERTQLAVFLDRIRDNLGSAE